jgi:hypothetical protein
MRSLLQPHVLMVLVAAIIGLVVGSRFIEPAILGALLGLGAGLGGGAFIAAVATGTNLASGNRSAGPGAPSIWDDEETSEPPPSNGSSH